MGGQIYRPPATAGAAAGPSVGPKLPQRLRRAVGHPRIRHLPGTTVWQAIKVTDGVDDASGVRGADGVDDARGVRGVGARGAGGAGGAEFRLWLTSAAGWAGWAAAARGEPDQLLARAVVVATGASEVALPFPGWELPGVTTVGAAQALLKGQGVVAGRRVLVAGSGPLLLPAAAGLAEAGVHVVAVLEANRVTPGRVAGAVRLAPFSKKVSEAGGYATDSGAAPGAGASRLCGDGGSGRRAGGTGHHQPGGPGLAAGTGDRAPGAGGRGARQLRVQPGAGAAAVAGVRGPASGRAAGRGDLVRRRPGDVGAGGVRGRGDDRGGWGRRRGAGRLCRGRGISAVPGTHRRGTF